MSVRVYEDRIDGNGASVDQAEPGERGRVSEQGNRGYSFNGNSASTKLGQLIGAQCKRTVGKESDVFAPIREEHCRLQSPVACRQHAKTSSSHFVAMAVETVEHADAPALLHPGKS